MMRNTAKMPRNPAEDALYRLTLAGDLFKEQVLARLDPTDRGMLRLVNKDLRIAVDSLGQTAMDLQSVGFRRIRRALRVGFEEQNTWAGSSHSIFVKAIIKGGNLDVLKRAT